MSAGGMPELGSKISLISKADIRYEGRLFTVDPQECTIALANVRSFGTEDRETSYPIMPQPTVYDYILFRGSDIKDIRVVNNVAIPNDPAIMQMHLPPQQNFPPQNFPQLQQPGGAPPMNQFGQFGQMQGGPSMGASNMPQQQQQAQSPIQSQHQGNNNNSNLAPGSGSGQKNKKSSELSKSKDASSAQKSTTTTSSSAKPTAIRKQSNKSQDSRSGTPQNLSRKSPTSDMGIQTNQNRDNQSSGNKEKPHQNQRNNQRNNNQPQQQQQQRERRDSGRNEALENKGGYRNHNQRPHNNNQMNNNHHQQQQQPQRGYNNNRNNNERGNNNDRGNNDRGNNNQMRQGNQGGSARMRGPPMHMNSYRQQNNQGAPIQNNQNANKSSNGPQQQQQRISNKPTTLKFDNEFDFETANSAFEELRVELARLKVGSEEVKSDQKSDQVNGEVEKKDDSGNETGADHEAENDENAGYDKNKSFFDNISCEAVERSKGKTQRTDWRQERKINSETFGYSGFNRRGNFRGRGGYYQNQYNRGPRQGGYRGGNPNYRPLRNHRNQNTAEGRNIAPNASQSTGQQSQSQSAPVAAN